MIKPLIAMIFLGLNFYIYQFMASNEEIPARKPFENFPMTIGDWHCAGQQDMDPASLKFLGATDYVICNYIRDARVREAQATAGAVETRSAVDLYVGYHESQVRREGGGHAKAIHPPEHCLPGSGWDIIDSKLIPIAFPGLPEGRGLRDSERHAKRFVIAQGDTRELVYFWYQGQGRVITANEDVILFRFWNRARRGRTDGALVRFTTRIERGDVAAAEARFQEFAALVAPILPDYLPN
jgi:EpsI family protein